MDTEVKRLLCDAAVTLNGQPARVIGWGCKFAKVVQNDTRLSCEFSWKAVHNVIYNREGSFYS